MFGGNTLLCGIFVECSFIEYFPSVFWISFGNLGVADRNTAEGGRLSLGLWSLELNEKCRAI